MYGQEQRALWTRELFSITETRRGDEGTYVYIALDITNGEEVAGAGVADVGVDGDGTA